MSHRALVLALGFAALPVAGLALARLARAGRGGRLREALLATGASGVSLLALLLLLEVGFQQWGAQSDGFGQTLAARQWFARYWGPLNAQGFRDGPIPARGRRLFVVGDSFVTGHGVRDRADRFADRLAPHLAPGWSVVNFARNGWNTAQELEALRDASEPPDALVWSYYLNDVEGAAARTGHGLPPARLEPPALLRPLVDRSYFVNFVYWRAVRLCSGAWGAERWRLQRAAYTDPQVWRAHRRELEAAVAFARERDIPLVAVVFPNLADAEGSRPITARIVRLLRDHDVPVLDLTDLVASRDAKAWTVNAVDAHPNERLHAEVAARLLPHLAAAGVAQLDAATAAR